MADVRQKTDADDVGPYGRRKELDHFAIVGAVAADLAADQAGEACVLPRLIRPRFDSREPLVDIVREVRFTELAVVDAVDPDLKLLADGLHDAVAQTRCQRPLIVRFTVGACEHQRAQRVRARERARMRRHDTICAAQHVFPPYEPIFANVLSISAYAASLSACAIRDASKLLRTTATISSRSSLS